MRGYDCIVIGAGIAGASAVFHLATRMSVVLLEREQHPGYHSTGRSVALFTENYGPRPIRILSKLTGAFLRDPPPGFAATPLVSKRGALFVARREQVGHLQALLSELRQVSDTVQPLEASAALGLCPILRADHVACAAHDHGALDIDVHALHQGYLRGARTQGAELVTNAEVTHLERRGERWVAMTPAGEFAAPIVVNAAGAWSDEIARMAGVRAVGLQPKRRTVAVVDPPPGVDIDAWPLVVDCEERWYFKPDAGRLLISPADETPVPPQDVRPEELDVAHAADRITRMTTLAIRHIRRSWAGLRSFVADRCPALGYATDTEGFFWLAGQGGYGIQTSHAMGLAAAALVLDGRLPDPLTAAGIDESELSPARL